MSDSSTVPVLCAKEKICANSFFLFTGELDHLPEVAFYMVGPIEEVVAKADRIAEET